MTSPGEGRSAPVKPAVQYIRVRWHQDYADRPRSTGTTRLGESPVPAPSEIAALGELTPYEISPDESESVWRSCTRFHGHVAVDRKRPSDGAGRE